jgi:7,8-dihydropterin-6-yl-methyl-4-(beta-D-ribofuranosyl)aminobenzene 5'-phosphate synthase
MQGSSCSSGCAHSGVIDTLDWVEHLFPNEPLMGVLGGMHLDGATAETTEAVVQKLREGIRFVAPGHCTGTVATKALLDALGSRGHALHVGMQIELHRSGQFELKGPCPI